MKVSIRPDKYVTEVVDLGYGVDVVSKVERDGSLTYYINSRLSKEKQVKAFQAEAKRIRAEVEQTKKPKVVHRKCLRYIDGTEVFGPMPVFYNADLKRVGRGIYVPTMMNVGKLMQNIDTIKPLLRDICLYYDIRQTKPMLPVECLKEAVSVLSWENVRFIGWTAGKTSLPAMAHFNSDAIVGTIYYRIDGSIDGLTIAINVEHDAHKFVVTSNIIRRGKKLSIASIYRSIDDMDFTQIY